METDCGKTESEYERMNGEDIAIAEALYGSLNLAPMVQEYPSFSLLAKEFQKHWRCRFT